MSSGPPTSAAGRHTRIRRSRGPATWSLRTRLILTLVCLVVGVCAIIGVFTTFLVFESQVKQLDIRLGGTANRAMNFDQHPPPDIHVGDGGEPLPFDKAPGNGAAGTLTVHITGAGTVDFAKVVSTDGTATTVPETAYPMFKALALDHPVTVSIGADDYRIVARQSRLDGDTIIAGLPMSEVYTTRDGVIATEAGIGLAAAILAAMLGTLLIGRNLRPLRRVAATASRVAELPLDRGEVALSVRVPEVDTDPRTEVGQVGAALNRMLGHVANALEARQASETRVRHFVADASHELRTPLAAIRGYAELTRRMSGAVPPDVVHALSRVESETARMTALVEDMLLLARLDSGRPVELAPVDLSRLVIDVVNDAHVASPAHRWQLDLPEESVTVLGDQLRLHQVLANLLANARTHTPPGTTVTTRIRLAGGGAAPVAALIVEDDGPGIPPTLLPEVFERFTRGDTSRSRAAGSTGLGLSIVAAVVEAHRGTVEVTSGPGRTVFTVRLPALLDSQPMPGARVQA